MRSRLRARQQSQSSPDPAGKDSGTSSPILTEAGTSVRLSFQSRSLLLLADESSVVTVRMKLFRDFSLLAVVAMEQLVSGVCRLSLSDQRFICTPLSHPFSSCMSCLTRHAPIRHDCLDDCLFPPQVRRPLSDGTRHSPLSLGHKKYHSPALPEDGSGLNYFLLLQHSMTDPPLPGTVGVNQGFPYCLTLTLLHVLHVRKVLFNCAISFYSQQAPPSLDVKKEITVF